MADSASSPATLEPNPQQTEPGAPNSNPSDPVPTSAAQPQSSTPTPSVIPNSNPTLVSTPLPPPPAISYAAAPPQVSGGGMVVPPPAVPSFRPLPQFSSIPNPAGGMPNLSFQNPAVQPPGVASGAGTAPVSVPQMQPMVPYHVPPGQPPNPAFRPPYTPMPNGYIPAASQGAMPPPGGL